MAEGASGARVRRAAPTEPPEVIAARADWLAQAAADFLVAMQEPDPELEAERAMMATLPPEPRR